MTRSETLAFFAARDDAWRRRDVRALAESHAEQGELTSPMFPRVRGRAAIEASYRSLFTTFPDWSLQQVELIVDDQEAAQVFKVTATHTHEFLGVPGSGREFEIQGIRTFTFDAAGLIQTERRIYDFTGLLVQIGVLKPRGK